MVGSAGLQPIANSWLQATHAVYWGYVVIFGVAWTIWKLSGPIGRFIRYKAGGKYEGSNAKKRYRQELKTRQAIEAQHRGRQLQADSPPDDQLPSPPNTL